MKTYFLNRPELIVLVALLAFWVSVAAVAQPQPFTGPRVCDIDTDGDIDIADLRLIRASNLQATYPGDPRDPNEDGRINVADVRFCQLVCTRERCAEF